MAGMLSGESWKLLLDGPSFHDLHFFYSNNILCKVNSLFGKVNFFPPKFFKFRKILVFQNTKKKFGGKKVYFANEGGPILFSAFKYCLQQLAYKRSFRHP
jgi:hypothetical protein